MQKMNASSFLTSNYEENAPDGSAKTNPIKANLNRAHFFRWLLYHRLV
jgi:hypothetical protein